MSKKGLTTLLTGKSIITILAASVLTTAGWWFSNRLDLAFGQVPEVDAIGAKSTCGPEGVVKEGNTSKEETPSGTVYYKNFYKCTSVGVYYKKVEKGRNGKKVIVDDKSKRPITILKWKWDHKEMVKLVSSRKQCQYEGKTYKSSDDPIDTTVDQEENTVITTRIYCTENGKLKYKQEVDRE